MLYKASKKDVDDYRFYKIYLGILYIVMIGALLIVTGAA